MEKQRRLNNSKIGLITKADGTKHKNALENVDQIKENVELGRAFYHDLMPYSKESETTKAFFKEIFEMLLRYICQTNDRSTKIVDFHHPHQFMQGIEGFSLELTGEQESLEQILVDCRDTLKYGVKTGHPRYFNQLSSGLDLVSLAGEWLTATANTNMFTFEIAPVFVLMEDIVLRRMRDVIGWSEGDGIFSPGGTISNLYGAMLARQRALPGVREKGMRHHTQQLVMFQSKHAHYSNRRPAALLGIGTENCIDVEVDERYTCWGPVCCAHLQDDWEVKSRPGIYLQYVTPSNNFVGLRGRMDPNDLERKIAKAQSDGKLPFYVTATAGTTVLGSFDRIPEISDICLKHGIWLHVDAAWGGGVLMSRQHRHLIEGVNLADSVTWNPHKMMGVILQCSAFLTKHKNTLKSCNSMNADYLFQEDKHYDISYDTGDSTIQCGRHVDIFKLWLAWRAKGERGFEEHVDKCIDLSRYLVEKVKKTQGFELVQENPQYTNVCFWYIPATIRKIPDKLTFTKKLHEVAPAIKKRMMENGRLMVGYQPLFSKVNFFRNVISNPAVEKSDVDFLVEEIGRLGEELEF